ncbi:dnaJ homolog subfamily C member 22 [Bacillus rossius redtenbacheri]|uniref:dnaJ homolog subfamily C member 22 n=1 Tax=Bacillus rossius redtenbacheri TaxID=93214 RepID=UPI002FDEB683
MAKKSLFLTYVLWLIGGIFGLHHFYLGRDSQAFLWFCTLGGYAGCGWLRDIFRIPEYVSDANEDVTYSDTFKRKIRTQEKPPSSMTRFFGMIIVAFIWMSVVANAIPEEPVAGVSWSFLVALVPLACALGVWVVGNIGREEGTIWWALGAAYATFPLYFYLDDYSTAYSLIAFASAYAFDAKSKRWRRRPSKPKSLLRRVVTLSLCALLYVSLWGSYLYFNARLTDTEGEEVPVHEALRNFLSSPYWLDVKQSFRDTWAFARHHGWLETWRQILDLSDLHGEQNAYKVLNLSSGASEEEIRAQYRALSKQYHPDKVKDPALKRAAEERFMELSQAYETISKIKSRRSRRNKKYEKEL